MKRMFVLILVGLLLSGCMVGTRVYTNEPEQTLPTFPDMELVVETHYTIAEINGERADGSTRRIKYLRSEKPVKVSEQVFRYYNEAAEFYEDDILIGMEHYEVDEKLNVIRMIPDGDENRAVEYRISYDEHGNITEKRTLSGGAETTRETFCYNGEGLLTEYCVYSGDTLISRTVTEYGENGWRQSETCWDGDGNILKRSECITDEKKYKETVLEYDPEGTLLRQIENGYDHGRNLVAQEIFDSEEHFLERTYWRFITESSSYLVPAGENGQ